MRLRGTLSRLAYDFARHRIAKVPLTWWLLGLTPLWIALLVLGKVPWTVAGGAVAVLAAVLLLAVLLGRRSRYVVFHSHGRPAPKPTRPLRHEEKIPIRATGYLEVSGMRKYFANIEAWFETVETREHIVIARNAFSRFLIFAKTLSGETGLWYAFFRPEAIQALEIGDLCFGWRVRPAVRIALQSEGQREREVLYLAFDDDGMRDLVLNDLLADAPVR